MLECVDFLIGLCGFSRMIRSGNLGHKCESFFACTCSAMAIVCACFGGVLYTRASGGFSLNEMSCTISAKVRVCKLPVLLYMAIGMILTSRLLVLCLIRACFSGSHILYMLLMVFRF